MTDLEIKRATGEGPVSFTTLPADRESLFDEQIGLERILGRRTSSTRGSSKQAPVRPGLWEGCGSVPRRAERRGTAPRH